MRLLKEKIEKDYKPSAVKLTDYEEEQEKNAIISYEELLKNTKNNNVSYDENYVSKYRYNRKENELEGV